MTMASKEDRLSSRCVSEHPSFMELTKDVLAAQAVLLDGEEDEVQEESFSLSHHHAPEQEEDSSSSSSSSPVEAQDGETIPKRAVFHRRVSFASLEIREYPVIPGDHPLCSSGCPIELGWDYHRSSEHSLDHYESQRIPRRNRDQLRLSVEERESLLSANDCPVGEVRRAARRHHRTKSCEGRFCQRNMQTFFSK